MKIYYRTKILINGIFPLVNFKIDGFIQKTGLYDEKMIDTDNEDYIFYSSGFLIKGLYSCREKKGNFYEYLINDELFEKDVPHNISEYELQKLMIEYQNERIKILEKKLRLISGYGINLPVFKTVIYNSKKEFLTYTGFINWKFTPLKAINYDANDRKKLEQRLQLYIADSTLKDLETKNKRFSRALYFYNSSFESYDPGIRFTLLFSALESLFNIDSDKVTEEVANFSSRILFLSYTERKSTKYKIKNYYNERSRFIHGNNNYDISSEKESNLRDFVREILLIYWNISVVYDIYDEEQIKKLILKINRDSLNVMVQLFIKYLRTDPNKFKKLYEKLKTNFLNNEYKVLNNESLDIE